MIKDLGGFFWQSNGGLAKLGGVTSLSTDTHPMAFQMPPNLGTGRDQSSGDTKKATSCQSWRVWI